MHICVTRPQRYKWIRGRVNVCGLSSKFTAFHRDRYHIKDAESWWRHQMETFSALLAIFAGNSPVPGEFPTQRPVTRSFEVYFDLRPNKWLSKQSRGWWFETLSCSLWRHRNANPLHLPMLAYCYMNQRNKLRSNFDQNTKPFIQDKAMSSAKWWPFCLDLKYVS